MGPVQCELVWDCVVKVGSMQGFLNFVRYYPIAGLFFLFFYVWKKGVFEKFRIQKSYPGSDRIWQEFRQSAVTLVVFTMIATTNITMAKLKWIPNKVYFGEVSGLTAWLYVAFSFILISLWHETWFYWMHRFAHLKPVYKWVHQEHHQSVNPTPLAAYRFQATEAFLEGIYLVFFIMVVPVHFYLVIFHTFFAMIMNIYFHSGYELYPKGFASHPIFKWFNTSTHHNLHHQRFLGNYGLYMNIWDRWMGTNFPNYEESYEKVVEKRHNSLTKEGIPAEA